MYPESEFLVLQVVPQSLQSLTRNAMNRPELKIQ